MSQKSRAKRAAKIQAGKYKQANPLDVSAEDEADAIDNSFTSHTMSFGKRLNKYYWVDGERFNTGKKHRANCVGMTKTFHAAHVTKRRNGRPTNLRSLNTHARICNPELYRETDRQTMLNPLAGKQY